MNIFESESIQSNRAVRKFEVEGTECRINRILYDLLCDTRFTFRDFSNIEKLLFVVLYYKNDLCKPVITQQAMYM